MNANQIKPLNDFLQRHMSQSQDAKISTRGTKVSTERPGGINTVVVAKNRSSFSSRTFQVCDKVQCGVFLVADMRYEYFNNSGYCLIKKHQEYIEQNDIYDFSVFRNYPQNIWTSFDEKEFNHFIEETNDIAEASSKSVNE